METKYKEIRNRDDASVKSYPMNGGEGQYSYAKTSSFYQQRGLDITKTFLSEEIAKKLDIKQLCSSSNSFNIADLGCSVGPNTLFGIQNIIQSIELTSQFRGLNVQFQVFFNDHTSNDFNTLFKSLPPDRTYFAASVPGTFYGRLFPENSLHFVHSSYATHWLSKVPKEVADKNSAAWNKGRVVHGGSKEVENVFSCQYENDMEKFLRARATEIVCGGFMALLLPCIPNGADPAKSSLVAAFDLVGSSLMELAKRGLLDEAEVDSFNLPIYVPPPAKLESLIQRNGCFKIERMEQFLRPMTHDKRQSVEKLALVIRAGVEGIIKQHLGSEFVDQIFNLYTEKLIESELFSSANYVPMFDLFIFLKRI